MGSWIGHADEACFFLGLAVWWMWKVFPAHIRTRWNKEEYQVALSYPSDIFKRQIPLEAFLKTLFPVCGLAGEIWSSSGGDLIDDDGKFIHLEQMQHMTIYGIFILHGVVDILHHYRAPLPAGFNYLTAALAFGWYALSFSFHAHMETKQPLETMVHVLPVYIQILGTCSLLVEMWKPRCFLAQVTRIFSVGMLGCWFLHTAFILFKPFPFPGNIHNEKWDQQDHRNIHAIIALFGMYLIMNMLVMCVVYVIAWFVLRMRGEHRQRYHSLKESIPIDSLN